MSNPYKSKTAAKPYKSKTSANPYRSKSRGGAGGRKNAKSTINKLSSLLLGTNKMLRDVNALQKGTIADRVIRRVGGKVAGLGLGKLDK